jgi:hypothetical protein
MTPFTEPVPMTLEVKDVIIASIGSTHKWALYDRADYDKLEDEEALEVLRRKTQVEIRRLVTWQE